MDSKLIRNILLISVSIICISAVLSQVSLSDDVAQGETMRVDIILAGNSNNQKVYLHSIKREPYWGGRRDDLTSYNGYGEYKYTVVDKTGDTLYVDGFCTLFEEWQTTEEAEVLDKSFEHTMTFPYPEQDILLHVERRNRKGEFEPVTKFAISHDNPNISQTLRSAEVVVLQQNGNSNNMVDLVFLAEGYTIDEMDKFKADAQRMTDFLFTQKPFDKLKQKFNIHAVCSPSLDSGISQPNKGRWVNSALGSSFNTFYIDRYLESERVFTIRDYASLVPYDHIIILANSDRYGGGGIYNHFSIVTANHPLSLKVFVHELGHGLAGLGDEYYSSSVAYQDYFNLEVEPWQSNLTTLVNFDVKWSSMVKKDTPVPTPPTDNYMNQVGVFEGGGYTEKGVYRPAFDCRMKTNTSEEFCTVCQKTIEDVVMHITE